MTFPYQLSITEAKFSKLFYCPKGKQEKSEQKELKLSAAALKKLRNLGEQIFREYRFEKNFEVVINPITIAHEDSRCCFGSRKVYEFSSTVSEGDGERRPLDAKQVGEIARQCMEEFGEMESLDYLFTFVFQIGEQGINIPSQYEKYVD